MAGYDSGYFLMQGLTGFATGFAQASALRAQGAYEARMLLLNAKLAEFQAGDAIKRGNKEAAEYQKRAGQLMGSQRVAIAGQGVQLGVGSAAEIQEDTAKQAASDVVTIRSNAWREAWGYRVQAQDYRGKAEMTRIGSEFAANATLLTGGMNALSNFTRAGASMSGGSKRYREEKVAVPGYEDPLSNSGTDGRWGRMRDGSRGYGYSSMWDD